MFILLVLCVLGSSVRVLAITMVYENWLIAGVKIFDCLYGGDDDGAHRSLREETGTEAWSF